SLLYYYISSCSYFFFTHTATTAIYTLSLHDALPIWPPQLQMVWAFDDAMLIPLITLAPTFSGASRNGWVTGAGITLGPSVGAGRSEEHTSELQSLAYLVCRLLLEKKKIYYVALLLLA